MKTVIRCMGAAGLQSRKRVIVGLRMRKDSWAWGKENDLESSRNMQGWQASLVTRRWCVQWPRHGVEDSKSWREEQNAQGQQAMCKLGLAWQFSRLARAKEKEACRLKENGHSA